MRQVFFDVLLWDEPLITGLLYEKQVEPAIREWLKAKGKAGLGLVADDINNYAEFDSRTGGRIIAALATSEHVFEVVER